MRFIVDAQLPKALSDFLIECGYDSVHTLDLPNANRSKDAEIVEFADQDERIVISKDSDFLESYLVHSKPKKLLLVTTGNIQNRKLLTIFKDNIDVIIEMFSKSNLIEISETEIVEQE